MNIDGYPVTPWQCKLPRSFSRAVRMVARPYVRITEAEYQEIMRLTEDPPTDCVKWRGVVYTFGNADGGYRLMPLAQQPGWQARRADNVLLPD